MGKCKRYRKRKAESCEARLPPDVVGFPAVSYTVGSFGAEVKSLTFLNASLLPFQASEGAVVA